MRGIKSQVLGCSDYILRHQYQLHSTQLYLINEYMYFDLYSEVKMLYYFIGKTNRTEIKI